MNSGGLAAVLPSTSVVEEEPTIIPNGMTYTDERFSSRWKERRARFLGCIENTKLIAERTKQRQENARIERLKKERAEMEKYRRRYLEAAMKQYMEQQAKPREAPSSIAQPHGHHHSQLLPSSQSYPGCMQVVRAAAPFPPNYPAMSACKPNIRKRPFEGNGGWTQYAHMTTLMNDPRNMYHGKKPEMFQNNVSPMQIATDSFKYSTMMSKQVAYCPTNNYNGGTDSNKSMTKEVHPMNCAVPELERAEQYDQTRLGSSILPTTSQAHEVETSTIPEEMNNLSTMPELAESHVKDLMDQIGPNNSLDDLGGNCLEGVLVNRCDDEQPCTLAAETERLKVQSASSSIVSPMSAPCGTPNSALSPAHLSASARCSTNSFYDSHSAAVTPQQSALTPPCDQSQRIPHYQFAHFQQYHHSRHQQQQQLLDLFNNGCHVSANNTQLSHMDNARVYSGIEYSRLGHCYNQYSNPNKSSIFPQFPSQTFVDCSTSQQYDVHSMKYPSNGMSYYAQQPEMNVQQQAYQFQVPLFQQPYHHHYHHGSNGSDPMMATQNPLQKIQEP
uniref:BZIP domain-containing protein n=1 Tax=Elaeophora elaphi TaxID=1147741 RepID=A0A158Q7N9_9BILA